MKRIRLAPTDIEEIELLDARVRIYSQALKEIRICIVLTILGFALYVPAVIMYFVTGDNKWWMAFAAATWLWILSWLKFQVVKRRVSKAEKENDELFNKYRS